MCNCGSKVKKIGGKQTPKRPLPATGKAPSVRTVIRRPAR